ncbi:aminoglycoside phosphotransferase [Catenulispora acidiphila DSM 44928]|uniref:Aminoglycoside phosphotransferase n=1 Tax=Catenulispora acidiphila (strain DSM 44928 / JCM 14897 / NBRC 102108 / NRRL B-24433 / ID139908) TaxID=479433 RepID=C7QH94_CATAD|nr:phosphotransferase [Catenulispora acidiphila]ACU69033.1 aminoglycoside phosphotransferase [Catenulispora acidiphila DSM 44928]
MPGTSGPLQALFLRFGLPAPTAFRPVDSGLLNRSYQITSADRRYFLKHYLPWRGIGSGLPDAYGRRRSAAQTLRWQHEAVIRLQAAGLPAVAPLRDVHGRTVAYVRGRPFAVFPWNDGVHRHGRHMHDIDARCLGTTLADVHTGLARVLPQVPQPLFVPTASERRAVAEAEQLLAVVDSGPGRDEMDLLSAHRLRERLALIPEVAHLRPAPDAVATVGYIHGDFHAGNVMWSALEPGSRVTAIVDWEKTAVAPCGDEVVSTALVFFTGDYSGQLDLDLVRAFIGGYAAARPQFSEQELADSVRRVWWERLTDFWILTWHYHHADHRADSLFPATAALVPWWTENYAKVLDAFLEGAAAATGTVPRR